MRMERAKELLAMCTAVTYQTKDFYFGRTLDYEFSYGDEVTITPRQYPFTFRHCQMLLSHYAMIGMAHVVDGCPLYYDAVNERGLCAAGLNFVGNACYGKPIPQRENVAQFELIPFLLSSCATVAQVRQKLTALQIVDTPFSDALPVAQLHWLIADRKEAITLEAVQEGLRIYDNPVGVLTNNPSFCEQMQQLNNYMHLSAKTPQNLFSSKLALHAYSRGMGAIGLPGDLSSQSRFVRAAFTKMNAVSADTELASVSQFFHILGAVEQQRGCCEVADGAYEITLYTSCCNADQGIYYYTTYENHQITAVHLQHTNLDADILVRYPLIQTEQICMQN